MSRRIELAKPIGQGAETQAAQAATVSYGQKVENQEMPQGAGRKSLWRSYLERRRTSRAIKGAEVTLMAATTLGIAAACAGDSAEPASNETGTDFIGKPTFTHNGETYVLADDKNGNGQADPGDTVMTLEEYLKSLSSLDIPDSASTDTESAQTVITPEMAAQRLGASDYSSNPNNWDILPYDGGVNGMHLTPSEEGFHTRTNTDGLPVEGYLDLKDGGELPFFQNGVRALTLVVNGEALSQVDMRGGTYWSVPNEPVDTTLDRLFDQVETKEHGPIAEGGQPGALVVPVGFGECSVESTHVDVRTAEQAAARFGVDEYTKNPANWEVVFNNNDIVGIHLKVDASGDHHRVDNLQGVFYEGYWDVKDDGEVPFFDKGVRAITFVGNGSVVPTMDMRGGTFWIAKNELTAEELEARTNHLLDQVTTKENGPIAQGGQPGVLIYPLGFNPNKTVC